VRFPIPGRLVFALAALLALALAQPANGAIAPDAAHSPNAEDMRTGYWVMLIVATLISLAFIGGLVVAVRRFRSERPSDQPRHLTAGRGFIAKLGAGLVALALAIFVFGIVVSNGVREATAEDGAEEIEIQAVAQQWLWRFGYPEQAEGSFSEGISTIFSYGELVVPVDTVVNLNIRSTDVIHSWFVPALGPQIWAVPGETQELSFIADEEGIYPGRSTVFSGAAGYPVMRAVVRVVSADEYADYIEGLNTNLQEGQAAVHEAATAQDDAAASEEDSATEEGE
jgi:heme/copper-type cytochrome/quinol oxidase subunit 2